MHTDTGWEQMHFCNEGTPNRNEMHHVQLRKALLAPNSSAGERQGWGRRGALARGCGFAFPLFPKLWSIGMLMDLQSLHRLKRKEVIASNRKPLTKCSFRDQGKGGWGGGGQLQLPPSPCSIAVLGPRRRTHSPAWPCPSSTWEHILHKPTTAPGSHRNVVGTCPLPWLKTDLQGAGAAYFLGLLM